MTQDEIIEMAVSSGFSLTHSGFVKLWLANSTDIEAFAKLVAEAEKERIAKKIEQLPFGDTAQSFAIWVRNDT